MFFTVSKLLWVLLTPSNMLLLLTCATVLWTVEAARRGRGSRMPGRCAAAAAIGTTLLAVTPLGRLPLAMVEGRFTAMSPAVMSADVDGAIVLGGALSLARSQAIGQTQFNEAVDRIAVLLEIAHRRPDLPLVFAGGDGALLGVGGSEAELLRSWLAAIGVDSRNVIFESDSRNTYENAVLTKAALAAAGIEIDGRWLLVTSAFHMPRAVATFRAQGFEVVPHPVDHRLPLGGSGLAPVSLGLSLLDLGVREWLGLAAYRMAGYSSELWPSPSSGSASR